MEQILYFIGQGLGVIAVILGFVNYQVKTREQVLLVNIATTLCFVLHYMLIGAFSGMVMNLVGFVRGIVFYFVGKNGKVARGWAILFAAIMCIIGIIGWEAWYSVFVVVALMINSYALSFSDPQNIRKSILITSPMVIVYDSFVLSFGGIVYESVAIISSVIGLWRFKKES